MADLAPLARMQFNGFSKDCFTFVRYIPGGCVYGACDSAGTALPGQDLIVNYAYRD